MTSIKKKKYANVKVLPKPIVKKAGATFEVPDVHAQDNYLACSLTTKSEIVVPIYAQNKLVGQIDIDSHELDPFTAEDHALLEWVAEFIAERL